MLGFWGVLIYRTPQHAFGWQNACNGVLERTLAKCPVWGVFGLLWAHKLWVVLRVLGLGLVPKEANALFRGECSEQWLGVKYLDGHQVCLLKLYPQCCLFNAQ